MSARWSVWVVAALLTSTGTAQSYTSAKPIVLVPVTFNVADHKGHFITDLTHEQFTVLDNGKPAKLAQFSGAGSHPLRIAIIIDKSRSMWERLPAAQHALGPFLDEIIRPDSDKAVILAFDEVVEEVTDFTGDPKILSAGINRVSRGGGSSVWDTVYFACRERLIREARDARLAIVLISDFDDTGSRVTRKEAIETAEQTGVTVYAIGTDEESDRGTYSAKMLAEATGGRALFPKTRDLSKALHEIAEDLRAQYYVSLRLVHLDDDGQFHSIQIQLQNKDLKSRSRKGYYARK